MRNGSFGSSIELVSIIGPACEKKALAVCLTLSGMREGTFLPLSFLDLILTAEFLSKIPNFLGGEN